MKTRPRYVVLLATALTMLVGAGCLSREGSQTSRADEKRQVPRASISGEPSKTDGRADEKQQVPRASIIGKWALVPSPEQKEFANMMGNTAGPLVYEFHADGTYTSVGGPLGPRAYEEHGEFTFDAPNLTFHRKGVNGKSAPIYEHSTSNRVQLSDDGSVLTGPSDFGGWLFQGKVRFEKQ